MNRELVSVRQGEPADAVLNAVLGFGITAVPVLDADRRPTGVVSLRDLIGRTDGSYHVSSPAITLRANATLEAAARTLAQGGLHHVVVVDAEGRAVGMLSAVDVLRGLVGTPASHPSSFPGFDARLGVFWTQDAELDLDGVAAAPAVPGVLVLISGGARRREGIVWAEACGDVQSRLEDLLNAPGTQLPYVTRVLSHGALRFRAAAVPDDARRTWIVEQLRAGFEHLPLPQDRAVDREV